jgi:hypothetical protein
VGVGSGMGSGKLKVSPSPGSLVLDSSISSELHKSVILIESILIRGSSPVKVTSHER